MKTLKGILLPIDIYNYEVNVIYGDKNLMKEYLKIKYPKSFQEIEDKDVSFSGAFCFVPEPNKQKLVEEIYIGETKSNYSNIAHECLHTALYLFESRQVLIDPAYQNGHEALTYLLGYMVRRIQNANKWYDYDFKKKKWNKK